MQRDTRRNVERRFRYRLIASVSVLDRATPASDDTQSFASVPSSRPLSGAKQ